MNERVVWVTAEVLRALAAQPVKAGSVFGSGDLKAWLGTTLTDEQRVHATSKLCELKFLVHRPQVQAGARLDAYRITADGAAAIEAARQGHVRKSGPKGSRVPNPVRPDALASRLWNLVRMRRIVDSDSTAATLCDAGDDVARTQATVRKYLRRWCAAGALAESAKRVAARGHSNGLKQYVLVKDSVEPPRWRQAAREGGAQ